MKLLPLLVLAACTTATPAAGPDVTIPIHAYTVGDHTLIGATYAETCAALTAATCDGDPSCSSAFALACCRDGECTQIVYTPDLEAWDQIWERCLAQVYGGAAGFECDELMPPQDHT